MPMFRIPHPAILIVAWAGMTMILYALSAYYMLLLATGLALLSGTVCRERFLILLRRTRWILVSIFAIYSYTTPGTPLFASLGGLSPVYEGVADGAIQLLRLLASLAGLAILLSVLTQSQLVAGLYTLSRPLALFRISSERFAVRLALTLRYAEGARLDSGGGCYAGVESWLLEKGENRAGPESREILELEVVSLTVIDSVIVAVTLLAIAGVWL